MGRGKSSGADPVCHSLGTSGRAKGPSDVNRGMTPLPCLCWPHKESSWLFGGTGGFAGATDVPRGQVAGPAGNELHTSSKATEPQARGVMGGGLGPAGRLSATHNLAESCQEWVTWPEQTVVRGH